VYISCIYGIYVAASRVIIENRPVKIDLNLHMDCICGPYAYILSVGRINISFEAYPLMQWGCRWLYLYVMPLQNLYAQAFRRAVIRTILAKALATFPHY
jgi:hypothetical protein